MDRTLQFFRALANESRLRIVGILADGEASVDDLATRLNLRGPTISHHLAKLRDLGLVGMRAEGTTHWYRLELKALRTMASDVLTPHKLTSFADMPEGSDYDRKVLRDFFEGERLREIPMKWKKRSVVLRWLAARFVHGRRYTEKEVNEIIGRHHPDFATIRRLFIADKLMARERGVYWRIDGGAK